VPTVLGRTIGVVGLLLVSPLIVVLGVAVRLTSPGPAFYRATRVGPNGTFTVHKLRTMRTESSASGLVVTAAADPRVTRLGRLLRRTKLDELPQLWDVARGEMALVGPRPEDPHYVDRTDPLHALVFAARPGITSPAALEYRDEERRLAAAALRIAHADGRRRATDDDVDRAYREAILPAKLAMDANYLRTRSTRGDFKILGRTIGEVLRGTRPD